MNRREFILGSAAACAAAGCRTVGGSDAANGPVGLTGVTPPYEPNLRDRCWTWGHDSGVFDGPDNKYKIPTSAPLTMPEANRMLGIPNICAITWKKPDEKYLADFRDVKRVSWLMASKHEVYERQVEDNFERLAKMPNLTGFDLDDFFRTDKTRKEYSPRDGREYEVREGGLSLNELENLKRRMLRTGRTLETRLVLYVRQLVPEIAPALDRVDTVLLWTWDGADVTKLAENWKTYRTFCPAKPTLLGIYMWDFGGRKPLEMDFMRHQLAFAKDLFRRGEIEGLIFHCTPLANKNLEAVECCRKWIDENADLTRA